MLWEMAIGVGGFFVGILTPGLSDRFTKWLNRYPRLSNDALFLLSCMGEQPGKAMMRLHGYFVQTDDSWYGMLRCEDVGAADPFTQIPLFTYTDLAVRFKLAAEELEQVRCCRVEDRGNEIAIVSLTPVGEARFRRERDRSCTRRLVDGIAGELRSRRAAVTAKFHSTTREPGLSNTIGVAIKQMQEETGECRTIHLASPQPCPSA